MKTFRDPVRRGRAVPDLKCASWRCWHACARSPHAARAGGGYAEADSASSFHLWKEKDIERSDGTPGTHAHA